MTKRTSPYSPTYNKFDLTSFKKKAISADTRIDFTVDNQQPKQVGNRLIKNSEKKQKQKEEEGDNQQLANKKITSFEEPDKENQTPSVLNQKKLSSYSLTLDSKVDTIPDNILDSMITRSISPAQRLGFKNDNDDTQNKNNTIVGMKNIHYYYYYYYYHYNNKYNSNYYNNYYH
jgi:hypothetical protein